MVLEKIKALKIRKGNRGDEFDQSTLYECMEMSQWNLVQLRHTSKKMKEKKEKAKEKIVLCRSCDLVSEFIVGKPVLAWLWGIWKSVMKVSSVTRTIIRWKPKQWTVRKY